MFLMLTTLSFHSTAALKLDRTRIIYPGKNQSVSLDVKNENMDNPYLAQSWLEDEKGAILEKYLTAVPPLVRVNAGETLVVRLEKLPDAASLPKDRESLFYYILREVPPKSDSENTLQLALQTKVKLFYRPEELGVKKLNKEFYKDIKISKSRNGIQIDNTTPYYVVMLAPVDLTSKKVIKNVKPVTLAPFQKMPVDLHTPVPSQLGLIFIDDYGGRPVVNYNCSGNCDFVKVSD